jgi:hypothetical protein
MKKCFVQFHNLENVVGTLKFSAMDDVDADNIIDDEDNLNSVLQDFLFVITSKRMPGRTVQLILDLSEATIDVQAADVVDGDMTDEEVGL